MHERILYVTAHAPWGKGETFILEEMDALVRKGAQLLIAPRSPGKGVVHGLGEKLVSRGVRQPVTSPSILRDAMKELVRNQGARRALWSICRHSKGRDRLANLFVFPKGVAVGRICRRERMTHIHCHWASTPATIGMTAAFVAGVPWSLTMHRWDIAQNNMLEFKVRTSLFARCIAEDGLLEAASLIGSEEVREKLLLLHMGVLIPRRIPPRKPKDFKLCCPANLVEKKGHIYLLRALRELNARPDEPVRCLMAGEGPLRQELEHLSAQLGLQEMVEFQGHLPQESLFDMYLEGEIDAVVLPSVVIDDGEREGIPVALIEAMAHAIPVIGTSTGGVPELLKGGAGYLVAQRDVDALVDAIGSLIVDPNAGARLAGAGRKRVQDAFDSDNVAECLLDLISGRIQSKKIARSQGQACATEQSGFHGRH